MMSSAILFFRLIVAILVVIVISIFIAIFLNTGGFPPPTKGT